MVLFVDESPKWLFRRGDIQGARSVANRLRGGDPLLVEDEVRGWSSYGGPNANPEQDGLLSPGTNGDRFQTTISLLDYVKNSHYHKSLIVVSAIMLGQQFCGINSIIFYGVKTIRKILPDYAVVINCLISLGNAVITFTAAPLIDRLGRIPCLLLSVSIMGASSILMAVGILQTISVISVIATFSYVGSYAIGLGPIPFLMVPEVTQVEARGAAQSYGTTVNWISTFLVGYLFPILDSYIGGYVYFIFAIICGLFATFIHNQVPETKGHKSYEEVWGIRND